MANETISEKQAPNANHSFGDATATKSVVTPYGTFHICDLCVGHLPHDHFRTRALTSDNPRQRCQCEHAEHFTQDGGERS